MNRVLFWVLIFLFLTATAQAYETNDVLSLWNGSISGNTAIDSSGNGNTGATTNITSTYDGTSQMLNFHEARDSYITQAAAVTNGLTSGAISAWIKAETQSGDDYDFFAKNAAAFRVQWYQGQSDIRFQVNAEGLTGPDLDPTITDWHLWIFTWDGTNKTIFLDNTLHYSAAEGDNLPSTGDLYIGQNGVNQNDDFAGNMTCITVWNESITYTDATELYALTRENCDLFAGGPTNITMNTSTESLSVGKQANPVSFAQDATIISDTFEITVNNTPIYGAVSLNILSNNVNDVTCHLIMDGVSIKNSSRTQTVGEIGSFFLQSGVNFASAGNHTREVWCEKISGSGLVTITNAVAVGHLLVDHQNDTLPYNTTVISDTATGGSAVYELIGSFNFTTGNKSNTNESVHNIVIEGDMSMINNDALEATLGTYMTINGTNSSLNLRTVASGGIGSTSTDIILENVSANTVYQIDVFGRGINAAYVGNLIAKDLFLANPEIVGGTDEVVGESFENDTWVQVFKLGEGGNFYHDEANGFTKVSYSVLTTGDTEVNFNVRLIDGATKFSNNFTRDYESGKIGVLTGHDVFEDLPRSTNYSIELWANCGTAGVTCTIVGGSSLWYITDVTPTTPNAFFIDLKNYYDGTTIFNFSASDDVSYSTNNGLIKFFTNNAFENITLSSDGYLDRTILNHNTSNNLSATIWQVEVDMRAFEIVTGNEIFNGDFTSNNTVTNETLRLNAGLHNITFNKTGYYNKTVEFNFSALYDGEANLTGVYNSIVNITPFNFLSGSPVSEFSVLFNYSAGSFSQIFNTTTSSLAVNLIQGNFTITFFKPSYLNTSEVINVNATLFNVSLAVYASTNISVNFFDEETLLPVDNVDFDILGSAFSSAFNTGAGNNSILLTDLPEDLYHIRYTADEYSARSYYVVVPITSSEFSNISLFLVNDSMDELFTRNVVGQDAIPLDGYYLELQRPYPSTDNTSLIYRTMELAIIDSQGDAVFSAIPNTQQYRFRILDDDLNLLNVLTPSFLIDTTGEIIADESLSTMLDFNTAGDVVGSLSFQNSTSFFIFDYTTPLTVTETCLRVTNKTGFSSSQVTVCSSDPLGTIAIFVNTNNSVTYEALAYVIIDGQQFAIDTETLDLQFIGEREALRYIGPFLYFLSVLMFGAMSFIKPAIGIFGVIGVTFAFSLQFLGLFWFSTGLIGGLVVLGIIVALVAEKGD